MEDNKQKNIEETDDRHKEVERISKIIRERQQKIRSYSDLSLRYNNLKDLKNLTMNNVGRLNQTTLETEELKKTKKPNMNDLSNVIKILPKKKPV